jgi:hypothetical protein
MEVGKIHILLLFFLSLEITLAGQTVDHYETILQPGDSCRYLVPSDSVNDDWTLREFNDSSWMQGIGGVGYGDNDDNTVIDASLSVYCRYYFTVDSLEDIGRMLVDVDFDDGFVAYLNGTEIARINMGEPGSNTTWDQPADQYRESYAGDGTLPSRFILDDFQRSNLVSGTNVFALEVHNYGINSSDLSSNLYLYAGIKSPQTYFSPVPDWFEQPFELDSTLLPLMVINTFGQQIPDEPRITAHMGLIDNGPGKFNHPGDPYNNYDGQISIEMRGQSSQYYYDKKSYSIETQTEIGTNNNVSLLGLPSENDWVLYGPFGDKSLVRNVITYGLFEKMGRYAPRTRFFEMVLNEEYLGIYVLTEKIKRDRNRVDMATLQPYDTSGIEITGGYLLRIDWLRGLTPDQYWISSVNPPYADFQNIAYSYYDPEYDELVPEQKDYIINWMTGFEETLSSSAFDDPETGYRNYIDPYSFMDMMFLNEISKEVDVYRLSTYFYKQKDSNGGKLVSGPPWDYNLSYGNNDYAGDVHETYNWMYTRFINPYWWKRFMEDPWFANETFCRWDQLRGNILSESSIHAMIDSLIIVMGKAIQRNYEKWPILDQYEWPNPSEMITDTYEEQITYLKNWISGRISWIDGQWGDRCISVSNNATLLEPECRISVYPNPGDFGFTRISFHLKDPVNMVKVRTTNAGGQIMEEFTKSIPDRGEFQLTMPDYSTFPSGIYFIQVSLDHKWVQTLKYIKNF